MITLREAIDQGKLEQYIAEHEGEIADLNDFNLTLQAMAGKSSEAPKTSDRRDDDD